MVSVSTCNGVFICNFRSYSFRYMVHSGRKLSQAPGFSPHDLGHEQPIRCQVSPPASHQTDTMCPGQGGWELSHRSPFLLSQPMLGGSCILLTRMWPEPASDGHKKLAPVQCPPNALWHCQPLAGQLSPGPTSECWGYTPTLTLPIPIR